LIIVSARAPNADDSAAAVTSLRRQLLAAIPHPGLSDLADPLCQGRLLGSAGTIVIGRLACRNGSAGSAGRLPERRDAKIAREITARLTERNAEVLSKRGLPVTPGTLYLAHFAGGAGAVAILSAMENADAALVMATADATGRTKREKIIKANPFLEGFTVADLRNWADRKMRVPRL
jgi:hypothetical protein